VTVLIIDCETTGVNPKEARLVQLAAYHMAAEPPWTFLRQVNAIVRPEGFDIPAGASEIHGISTERARREGRHLGEVLDELLSLALDASADPGRAGWLVAHNLTYDATIINCELDRAGLSIFALAELLPFCTMRSLETRCKLPGRWPGKFKWPTLHEAYRHCFGASPDVEKLGAAHSAMGDVLACRDIYIHGFEQGWWGR
jgi:DNA polymerase III epsilon subunit-like protein